MNQSPNQTSIPVETALSRPREHWGTRIGLVLAMAGNAIGLGNFIRFPAQAAQNGGGAFLIPYLISFVLMGIPLLWVEWAIGRHGGIYGHHSAPGMLDKLGRQRWLKYIGVFGLFTNLCIAAYYCYIESWTLAYAVHSVMGSFGDTRAGEFFLRYLGVHENSLFALPMEALIFFTITLAVNVYILSRGVHRGIELVAKIGMPLLLIFGAMLAITGLTLSTEDPQVVQSPLEGLNFVWQPDLSGLSNPTVWLAAAGQIFFTLSVGMGCVHAYASYIKKDQDIALNASSAAWLNEFAEVVLGSAIIIPIATAYMGLDFVRGQTVGGSGLGLGFQTLPDLFNNWGWFAPCAGLLWFGLLFIAALTSSLAMGQPILAFLEDEFNVPRSKAALVFGAVTFALGFFCVWLFPGGAFDEFDYWAGTFSLVVFALAEVIIFAWVFGIDKAWAEITRGADIVVPRVFRFVIRFITPVFILVIFLGALIKPMGDWTDAVGTLAETGRWPFSPDSVIGKLLHVKKDGAGLYEWFGPDGYGTPDLVQDLSRLLLAGVFVGIAVLVWLAWRRKGRAVA